MKSIIVVALTLMNKVNDSKLFSRNVLYDVKLVEGAVELRYV